MHDDLSLKPHLNALLATDHCFLCAITLMALTMNTRPIIETSNNPVALSAAFNQDNTCFAVGLDSGFCSEH